MYTVPGGYGYDISKQAINVAKENAKLNDVPAIFERSNLFEDVADETFDVIVSNPPYIRSDEIPFLMPEVSEFEPHEALDGKKMVCSSTGRSSRKARII